VTDTSSTNLRALFPGSFDPPTTGHESVLTQACRVFPEVLVGLAVKPGRRSLFSKEERLELLEALVARFPNARLVAYEGLTAAFALSNGVAVIVRGLRDAGDLPYERELAMGNAALGRGLPTVFFLGEGSHGSVSGRLVREIIESAGLEAALSFIPSCCHQTLHRLRGTAAAGAPLKKGGTEVSEKKEPVLPRAIGPYSVAVRAGRFVFLSGQVPIDPQSGRLVGGDIKLQTRRVLQNIEAVLQSEGLSLDKVVKTTVYLIDLADFEGMNEEYARFFGEVKPARSTVQVAALPAGARIEIEAVVWAGPQ